METTENSGRNLKKYIPLIVLPLALAIALGTWSILMQYNDIHTYYANGEWDLRDADVYTDYLILRTAYVRSVIMGGFLVLFLIHFMLYLVLKLYVQLKKQEVNLYFALFCFAWCLLVGVMRPSEASPFSVVFPWMTWEMEFRMEYILTFPVQFILLVIIVNTLFPGLLQRYFRWVIYIAAVFATVFMLFAETAFMSAHTALVAYIALFAALVYIAIRFIVKIRKVNSVQAIFLCASVLAVYFVVADFLYRLDIAVLPLHFGHDTTIVAAFICILYTTFAIFVNTSKEMEAIRESKRRLSLEMEAIDRVNHLRAEMMRTISHEIRTPLSVMMGYAELSAEEARSLGISERMVQNLDAISGEARHLANIAEEMRQFALIPEYVKDRHPVDVFMIISKVAELFEKILAKNGRELILDMQKGLPKVFGAESELTSVMFNLLRNAQIHGEYGDVLVTAKQIGSEIEVVVRDSGRGIDEGLLHKIFDRGVSGIKDGSGYGLAICKDIFDVYGGSIRIENNHQESKSGVVVTFTLPVYDVESL